MHKSAGDQEHNRNDGHNDKQDMAGGGFIAAASLGRRGRAATRSTRRLGFQGRASRTRRWARHIAADLHPCCGRVQRGRVAFGGARLPCSASDQTGEADASAGFFVLGQIAVPIRSESLDV